MYSIDKTKCVGCGVCLDSCPQGAIYMVDNTAEIDETRCTSCGRCAEVCPRHAIQWQEIPVPETATNNTSTQHSPINMNPQGFSNFPFSPLGAGSSRGRGYGRRKRFGAKRQRRW